MTELQTGRIVREGMGGFLCPPGHPEHTMSVETDLQRAKHNRGAMSLTACAESENMAGPIRQRARDILKEWEQERRPLDDAEVQDWVRQAMGYFRNCYKGNDDGRYGRGPWTAESLHVCGGLQGAPKNEDARALFLALLADYGIKDKAFWPRCFVEHPVADHAGVHLIRQYYPEFTPGPEHFAEAHWGTRKEANNG